MQYRRRLLTEDIPQGQDVLATLLEAENEIRNLDASTIGNQVAPIVHRLGVLQPERLLPPIHELGEHLRQACFSPEQPGPEGDGDSLSMASDRFAIEVMRLAGLVGRPREVAFIIIRYVSLSILPALLVLPNAPLPRDLQPTAPVTRRAPPPRRMGPRR